MVDNPPSVTEPFGDCRPMLELENILINDGFLGGDISRSVGKVKQLRSKVIFRSPRSSSVNSSSTANSSANRKVDN